MRIQFRRGIAKVLAASLVMSGLTVTGFQAPDEIVEAAENNYQLVWSDEFDGNSLNRNNWNVEVNGEGGGNGELQYYVDDTDNIKVSNGTLKITALKEDYNGKSYTSGRINTNNKHAFQYARFEARMKLPRFSGSWPAFWTLGDNYDEVGWPACGEIDIMEAINAENKTYSTVHWSYNWNHAEAGSGHDIAREEWHVYAMEQDVDEIRFYVDDVNVYTIPVTYESQMEELLGPQFIILNLAIGGSWPGNNIDNSAFPNSSTMEVDYVRVYEDVNSQGAKAQMVTRDSNWHRYGNWDLRVESGYGTSTAQVSVDPADQDHIKLQQLSSSWEDANLVQARYTKTGLTPGQKYKISVDLKSNSLDGSYVTDARDDGAAISLLNGTRTVTKTAVADSQGNVSITFGTGWVGTSVVLDFSNVYCRVYDPNEVEELDDTMEFISVIKDDAWHNYGNWQLMVGAASGSQAKVAVDATDNNHIQVQQSQADWSAAYPWSVQAKYTAKGLTPGQTYTISMRMLTSSTDGSYVSDAVESERDVYTPYINGIRYVSKTGVADGNGELSFALGFGYSGVGVIADFDDITVSPGTTAKTPTTWNYTAAADDTTSTYGNWSVYLGTSWSGAKGDVAVDPANPEHFNFKLTASTWMDAWSHQVKYTKTGLVPGQKYKLTLEMTSSSGDGSYISDALPEDERQTLPLQVGTKTITKIAEADANGVLYLTFGFGYCGVGVNFEFDKVNVIEYSETQNPPAIETTTEAPAETTTAPSTQPSTGNLAAGKNATASGAEGDGMAAMYAVDQNAGTRWSSNFADDAWITVDLGAIYSVNKVVLNWEGAYGKDYKIQTSTDGQNFTTVLNLTGQDGGEDVITFNATNARYVRMQGVTRALPYGYSLWEMEVYGGSSTEETTEAPTETPTSSTQPSTENLAAGKNTSSSGSEDDGTDARYAVDKNVGTRWSSNFADDAWITVDLGATYSVSKVVLNWEAAYGKDYKIQTSTDGQNFTTVQNLTNQDGGEDVITFNATNARYVRMQGVTRALPYGYSLWEMEVYGGANGDNSDGDYDGDIIDNPFDFESTELAKGKAVTASGVENDAMSAANAVDGDAGTRWSSNFADDAWITVDLGATYSVDKVVLNWEGAYGKDYKIQTSTDGQNFTTVQSLIGQDGGEDVITFNATKARYVRMQGVTRALPYGYSLWEMSVYGK